jgi:hypothetical protein
LLEGLVLRHELAEEVEVPRVEDALPHTSLLFVQRIVIHD